MIIKGGGEWEVVDNGLCYRVGAPPNMFPAMHFVFRRRVGHNVFDVRSVVDPVGGGSRSCGYRFTAIAVMVIW